MANNTRGPRSRSRKPRPQRAAASPHGAVAGEGETNGEDDSRGEIPRGAQPAGSRRARSARVPAYRDYDDRPQAPWHPLPLSEILILAGAIAFVVALTRLGHHGIASAGPLLLAGVLALGLGTAEVSWREHRSGFRSHTLLLAFIPVLALHTAVVVGYSSIAAPSRALNIGMLVVDVAVFLVLARHLRASFRDARARR
ncbi:MAG TPA: hypothetical protein VFR48_09590 [Solirubrobacteraceae bacterium]|nr:hypothetical protein [Solirubrobacteraceae bacterium]